MQKLYFAIGNSKLDNQTAIFSLPAGHSCPGAATCLSKANRNTGKLKDGPNQEFRCYAASLEAVFPKLRSHLWNNFDLLRGKNKNQIIELIQNSLPNTPKIRIHSAGDFYSQDYFDAWIAVAKKNKNKIFYAYTKSLPFWVKRIKNIPSNMILTASQGGKHDELIQKYKLKTVEIVFNLDTKLKIDHDDSMALNKKVKKFALLIHGRGKAGSKHNLAMKELKKLGWKGYSKKYETN